jgi:hypothetical protein
MAAKVTDLWNAVQIPDSRGQISRLRGLDSVSR